MAVIELNNVTLGSRGDVFQNAGAPSNGTSGSFANKANKGSLLVDSTNGKLYQNTNTKASPTWTEIDTAANEITQQANIAPLGATSNLVGVDGVGDNAAPLAGTEARLDAIEAKLDAVIAALVAAGVLAAA